ncbi:zinc finger domain-containing protein [Arcanobacterium hippocoleae]
MIPTEDEYSAWNNAAKELIPSSIRHIARDVLDPNFNAAKIAVQAQQKKTRIKTLLLNQSFVSGIGNIYADEALWEAKINGMTPANKISAEKLEALFLAVQNVMRRSIKAGGTSFDSLYVNVNGSSGYFSRELNAYGRAGQPCKRCTTLLVREPFMGRSSCFCPKCQSPEIIQQ